MAARTNTNRVSLPTIVDNALIIEGTATPVHPTTGTDLVVLPTTEEPTGTEEPVDPLAGKSVLFVDSPIKKALFEQCILPEFQPGGKWGGKSQVNLVKPWLEVVVVVAGEGQKVGRNFDAQKSNWNVNDSNWVNPEPNYRKLAKAAREANGGTELPKKTLVGHLEDLKGIFQKRAD